jgi:branched-subunit amino acid aminotransferase/4-amino-4-deoxychorismate lyase
VKLLLDLDGNVAETSGANFLISKQRVVILLLHGTIYGISRQNVIELCAKLQIAFTEREFQVHDVDMEAGWDRRVQRSGERGRWKALS